MAAVNPIPVQPQPFLKELLARGEMESSSSFSMVEETPLLSDVRMGAVEPLALAKPGEQKQLAAATKIKPLPLPDIKRESSEASTGSTEDLSLSEGDSVDSLHLSGKLFGREDEEKLLLQAFDDAVTKKAPKSLDFTLISGATGTGKTRLGDSLRTRVAEVGGIFCSGKFDQHQGNPFAPLCAAFHDYVNQILRLDEDTIRSVRQSIFASVGGELPFLAHMLPPLAILMPDEIRSLQGAKDSCKQCDQQNARRIFALHKLFRAIGSRERPIVVMLDDIQWAPRCPLEKLQVLINDDMNEGIMFLGICRDDVDLSSELSGFLRSLDEDKVKINNIVCKNLQLQHVRDLVKEVFSMSDSQTMSLADFIFKHSQGNPYFIVESLKMMQQDTGLFVYDAKNNQWSLESDCQAVTCCSREFLGRKVQTLPREIQKVLMAAASLGSDISERALEVALQEPLEDRFQVLVKKGKFVLDEATKLYSFRHNTFQSVCFDLIAPELQPAFQLEVGLRLWKHFSEEEVEGNLFLILNLIKAGAHLITDQNIRYEVAALCIRGAELAAAGYSFPTASEILRFAFTLLGENHWKEAYDLSVVLFNYAAEVEFAQGDSIRVDELVEEVLANAKDCPEQFRAYMTRIYVLGVRGDTQKAIDIGIKSLSILGINFKSCFNNAKIAFLLSQVSRKLKSKSDSMLRRLQPMRDEKKLMAMQILNLLFLNTYIARKDLFPFVVLKMMKLTLNDGMSAMSIVAFAGYGTLLCGDGNMKEGLRYGQLALDLLEEWDAQSFRSRVLSLYWGSMVAHSNPLVDSLPHLREGHRTGLMTGDAEFAMVNAFHHLLFMLYSGSFTVSEMINSHQELEDLTVLHGHKRQLSLLSQRNMLEVILDPDGDLPAHQEHLEQFLHVSSPLTVRNAYRAKLFLYTVTGEYKAALEMIDRCASQALPHESSVHEVLGLFLDAKVFFGNARFSRSKKERKALEKRASACMRQLREYTKRNPGVCLGKLTMLEAGSASFRGNNRLAEERYERAFALAQRYDSCLDQALAKQRLGEHFVYIGDLRRAVPCFHEAAEFFERWEGYAIAKLQRKKAEALQVKLEERLSSRS
eukprot:Nitzschia sp. Nitz4//scaffold22_size323478//168007//171360//NITZ4_000542-RA/size323478-augustus-gene-0.239-mRNA-1//-1//CDS//3329543040//6410//frame0